MCVKQTRQSPKYIIVYVTKKLGRFSHICRKDKVESVQRDDFLQGERERQRRRGGVGSSH